MVDEITIGSIYNGRAHNMRVKILTKAMMNRREKNNKILWMEKYIIYMEYSYLYVFFFLLNNHHV